MEYSKKSNAGPTRSATQLRPQAVPPHQPLWTAPELTPLQRWAADLTRFTSLPVTAQRQAVGPVLQAATLHRAEEGRLTDERTVLQRQLAALPPVKSAQARTGASSPAQPVTAGDWVTILQRQAEQINGQLLGSREHDGFIALQRQVAQALVQGFRQDRQAPDARYALYGEQLATLQRHPNSAPVSRVVLTLIPQRERLPLQRAVDQALHRQAEQDAQEQSGLQFQALQRKKADLEEEALQPIMQRIAARRGAGNPLPVTLQRQLEQGLNHDLSRVRIHDDAEADKLSQKVNAVAFTTGTDIFFRSGQFNPNTQSGLELLAHEVTHTVQQSSGKVGPGIDPDAGLEAEARQMGKRIATQAKPFGAVLPAPTLAPVQAGGGFLIQRQAAGGQSAFKFREGAFWKALPGALLEGAKQSLVDLWELLKNLPVITQQLPALTKKALGWLRTMDTVQEWKAVAQALKMSALTAGEGWLKKTAAEQGRSLGHFVGKLIGEIALGKGAGAALKALKGGGGLVKLFDNFTQQVDAALQQINRLAPGRPALAVASGTRALPPNTVRPAVTTRPTTRAGGGAAAALDPRDLAVQKLLGKIPANFAKVRQLIGLPFDKNTVPKTDYYIKQVEGVPVIVRKVADDQRFTPLTIDANGRVQVNVVERLSNANTMKKNFKATWGPIPAGHWIHHLIPDTLIRNHPVGQALQKLGYDLDSGANLMSLPGKGVFDANVDVVGHWTDHQQYTAFVKAQLEVLKRKYSPLDPLSPQKGQPLLQDVKLLEDELREKLKNDFFKKRPDGSLAASPTSERTQLA